MSYSLKLSNAIKECEAYERIGGLTKEVIADIAYDNDVNKDDLIRAVWLD